VFRFFASGGQPPDPPSLGAATLQSFSDVNWPTTFANTGVVGFTIPEQLANASTGTTGQGQDEWYVVFQGPLKPGMLDATGLEVWWKGPGVNVQVGLKVGNQIQYGPYGDNTVVDAWHRARAPWPAHTAHETATPVLRFQGPIADVLHRAGERFVFDHLCPYRQ
jgi:hypothetical protein